MSQRYIPKIYLYDNQECSEHIVLSRRSGNISVDMLKVDINNRLISTSYCVSSELLDLISELAFRFAFAKESYTVENIMVGSTVVSDVDEEIILGGEYEF